MKRCRRYYVGLERTPTFRGDIAHLSQVLHDFMLGRKIEIWKHFEWICLQRTTVTLAGGRESLRPEKKQQINEARVTTWKPVLVSLLKKKEKKEEIWLQIIHRMYFYHLTASNGWKRHILIKGGLLWVPQQLSYKRQGSQLFNKHFAKWWIRDLLPNWRGLANLSWTPAVTSEIKRQRYLISG